MPGITENTESWEVAWELVGVDESGGGQASVRKVRKRSDGTLGALKVLREEHRNNSERRYRVQAEVGALTFMNGDGVPQVLATNAAQWRDAETELYLVTEWIDGPVLSKVGRQDLDTAIACTIRLAETIERAHSADVVHRDIKPDNVVCRGGDLTKPVLLDFGMAWSRPRDPESADFRTPLGIEIGNRFLRLPENAPGRESRDSRSDVASLAGVLFFLVTTHAPRVLLDEQGRMPHQRGLLPVEPSDDPRWTRLGMVLTTAFQQRVDFRYDSMAAFRTALARVIAPPASEHWDLRDLEDRIQSLTLSAKNQELAHLNSLLAPAFADLSNRFSQALSQGERRAFLMTKSGDPRNFTAMFHVQQRVGGSRQVGASGRFRWTTQDGEVCFSYAIRVRTIQGRWKELYRGPVADVESLVNAQASALPQVSREILAEFAVAFERWLAEEERSGIQ